MPYFPLQLADSPKKMESELRKNRQKRIAF